MAISVSTFSEVALGITWLIYTKPDILFRVAKFFLVLTFVAIFVAGKRLYDTMF
jgi:hypothetical protein